MVDKALFIDASGAKDSMHELEMISNNLANLNTIGFRADYQTTKQAPVNDDPNQTRVYSTIDRNYSKFDAGPITNTGRDLDIALAGPGFISVQSNTGQEGYTRAGDLQLRKGFLTTHSGDLVLGSSGPISIPEQAQRINISKDGFISVKLVGQTDMVQIDRIKLANPNIAQLNKGNDGLFYLPEGENAKLDPSLRLTPGALEGSNVNAVQTLTDLIDLSRRFEFHTHLMNEFKDSASKANQMLNVPRS